MWQLITKSWFGKPRLKPIIAFIGITLCLFSLWWNNFVFLKKLIMTGDLLYRDDYTPESYRDKALDYISFHPELKVEGPILYIWQGVVSVLTHYPDKINDVRLITTGLEPELIENAWVLNYPGRVYAYFWLVEKQEKDYRKSVYYFNRALGVMPNHPIALYNLYTLYSLHGDKEKAEEIRRVIMGYNWPEPWLEIM